ncbi:MAG TPA: BON domain-containing protein [Gammaproteobacteria bacterium]|nr:BON domain-containing protein [Gammaproteobacteria bacterium]
MNRFVRCTLPLAGAAALLMLLAGCVVALDGSSHPKTYTTGQWIQHQAQQTNAERGLASRVVAAIDDDPLLSQMDIDVRVTDGVVTLTGQVFDLATYEHAIQVVEKVSGVQRVVSRIELDLGE